MDDVEFFGKHAPEWSVPGAVRRESRLPCPGCTLEGGAGFARELFRQHSNEFLRHVRRHILQDELAGDLPKDAVNPRDVLNEVARRAEAKADKGPTHGSWLTWFYRLIHQELEHQRRRLKQEKAKQAKTSPEDTKVIASQAPTADVIRDRDEVSPVEIAARKDVVTQLEQDMRNWPRSEREVFELYYVEGFDPEESRWSHTSR